MDADALRAWVECDAAELFARTGAVFDEPVGTPPLFDEDLPSFLERMDDAPEDLGWWVWLMRRVEDGAAVGVCGLGGRPDPDGVVSLGYSVYPVHERCGFATEASRALVEWALAQQGVTRVRATVTVDNAPSIAVARKLGMREVARGRDPELGDLVVFEVGNGTTAGG